MNPVAYGALLVGLLIGLCISGLISLGLAATAWIERLPGRAKIVCTVQLAGPALAILVPRSETTFLWSVPVAAATTLAAYVWASARFPSQFPR